ncbi:hypothetical protein OSB04_008141 [Centaurea solstitialis]|uniref:Reverse transcriptase domain-containing protein n=1 Tax=Centaurea solstitialis TaxID=347529 RepID=A0AA38TYZ1_9ASTR|nr:hypothetical protein OSB04_008141 [Centaurea solstitialis]
MNFLSLNVRGLCSTEKKVAIRNLIVKENCNVFGLQETKLECLDRSSLRQFWGHDLFNFNFGISIGASGGTVLSWNISFFSPDSLLNGDHFCGAIGSWTGVNQKVGFLCVYAPQSRPQKLALWNELKLLILSHNVVWVVFGDFNAVRSPEERKGYVFDLREASEFNDFILNLCLHDLQLGGRKFTRFSKDGSKLSKLDRFLVSANFFSIWGDAKVIALLRNVSDHCPLVLKTGSIDFGPKPLKVFDSWLSIPSFEQLVKNSWGFGSFRGTSGVILKNKIKRLKQDIRLWSSQERKERALKKTELSDKLHAWDRNAENGVLPPEAGLIREDIVVELSKLEIREAMDLKQKSRIRWATNGDENSKFFHSIVNQRWRKNCIKGLSSDGRWIENPSEIKNLAKEHFANRFSEHVKVRPSFRSDLFRKLSPQDAAFLESPITMEEIKSAVWSCAGSKAPGPDGLSFSFIKKFWDIVKLDIFNRVSHFESTGRLARGCNASFIALVPKVSDPLVISDFRPISLIGCLYKIIAKLLATRLASVMDTLISENQSAFISGRQILDSSLIANEVICNLKEKKMKALVFKVDFAKAFDSVNWNFLLSTMSQMGFGQKWCSWIKGCLTSASVSVLVNGSPTEEFLMERGLRQGDPLSPFLFLIVGEVLQIMVREACNKGLFKGLTLLDRKKNLSLLQYADDALFFGKWSRSNIKILADLLNCFHDVSGLKIIFSKSRLFGIGVPMDEVQQFASLINCKPDQLPFLYLGLPVGDNMNNLKPWSKLVEGLKLKLNSWKARIMSFGGRLTLVPDGILKQLEATRRRFFWGFKEAGKEQGGLGVINLGLMNIALLSKWFWKFHENSNHLWKDVVSEFYGLSGGFDGRHRKRRYSPWFSIIDVLKNLNMNPPLLNSFEKKISAGSSVRFWTDKWVGSGTPLKSRFPRLFAKESNKSVAFKDRWALMNGVWKGIWSWNSTLRGRTLDDFTNLESFLANSFFLPRGKDFWYWKIDSNGLFSVKKMYNYLQQKVCQHPQSSLCNKWSSLVPIKVNILVWRLFLNALPTKVNLARRGIVIHSTSCVFCNSGPDEADHCLFSCSKIDGLWRKVWSWMGLTDARLNSAQDFQTKSFIQPCSTRRLKGFDSICMTVIWCIWSWRNRILHCDDLHVRRKMLEDLFPGIQRLSALWISSRCNPVPLGRALQHGGFSGFKVASLGGLGGYWYFAGGLGGLKLSTEPTGLWFSGPTTPANDPLT